MCKYAMVRYKPHYACFKCRKTFKRRLMWDITRGDKTDAQAKCPQCGNLMADMGLDFASPKKEDIKSWKHIETLFKVGITYHSCGCSGPGYIPEDKDRLIAYYEDLLEGYHRELIFWRKRNEPTNEKEIQREYSKHWDNIQKVPYELKPKKGYISNEDAKKYWYEKINTIQEKLDIVKSMN